jgi:hypothetical protein
MKTFAVIYLVGSLSLAANSVANAYVFSPADVSARLHGKLTFSPNRGTNTKPFECSITLDLKTQSYEIKSVKFPKKDCENVNFQVFPWYVSIKGAKTGQFSFPGFTSKNGNCASNRIQFQDNKSGIFTLDPGQCLAGTLTSDPPVTIGHVS